jgi:hypothetical protein
MIGHASWTSKKKPTQTPGIFVSKWDADLNRMVLQLIDRGHEAMDRYSVKFQGQSVYFGPDYDIASASFDELHRKHFGD